MWRSFLILGIVFICANTAFAKSCLYQLDSSKSALSWTAYKFTEKKGVKGTFAGAVIEGSNEALPLEKAIQALKVSMDSAKVDSGDKGRDANLVVSYFKFAEAMNIEGSVKSSSKDKGVMTLKWNNTSMDVPFTVKKGDESGIFTLSGEIKMSDFRMGKAFENLKAACQTLHTGTDGKTKTWPEVSLELAAHFKESCR